MDNITKLDRSSVKDAIKRYISNPPENSRVFKIWPDDAEWILGEFNLANRSKKPIKIKKYSEHMSNGTFGLTGDTLKFSDQGILMDGQNRLTACIRSGKPFTTHVVFGIQHKLFKYLDRGKNRGPDDVLQAANFSNTTHLSAAARWVRLIETDQAKQRYSYEPDEILRMVEKDYKKLPDFIAPARAIYSTVHAPIGLTAAILYLASKIDAKKADEFARVWEQAGQDRKGKPIRLMLDRLAVMVSASHGRIHDTVRAAIAVIAWNLFYEGKSGTQKSMEWNVSDDFPKMAGL